MQIGEKYNFREENFHRLLTFAAPMDATPPNFMQKTFTNSHKPQNSQKFLPSKVFRYTVFVGSVVTLLDTIDSPATSGSSYLQHSTWQT